MNALFLMNRFQFQPTKMIDFDNSSISHTEKKNCIVLLDDRIRTWIVFKQCDENWTFGINAIVRGTWVRCSNAFCILFCLHFKLNGKRSWTKKPLQTIANWWICTTQNTHAKVVCMNSQKRLIHNWWVNKQIFFAQINQIFILVNIHISIMSIVHGHFSISRVRIVYSLSRIKFTFEKKLY